MYKFEREDLLSILDSMCGEYRSILSWRTLFVVNTVRPTSHTQHASGVDTGAHCLCRFRRRSLRHHSMLLFWQMRVYRGTKTDELFHLLAFKREFRDSSILSFTETWLDSTTPDTAVPPCHALFRADRSSELTDKERGGGVCFLVNQRWCNDTQLVSTSCSRELETLTINCKPF